MIGESTKQFDLYDFFSIFLPGAWFLLSLFPFLPHDVEIFNIGLVGILLVVGFVFGRFIHASALIIDDSVNATTHRSTFVTKINEINDSDSSLVDAFYQRSIDYFPSLILPEDRACLDDNHEPEIENLYNRVRAFIHFDSRGRSRTFQAIFDFYRCMYTSCALLLAIYVIYGIAIWIEPPEKIPYVEFSGEAFVEYQPFIASLGLHPAIIITGALCVFGFPYYAFRTRRSIYRTLYIDYLMTDFLLLIGDNNLDEDIGGGDGN